MIEIGPILGSKHWQRPELLFLKRLYIPQLPNRDHLVIAARHAAILVMVYNQLRMTKLSWLPS
jgi:hypothetical protein